MNFKYYFHGKISVSPKDSQGDYFTIEPRIECIEEIPMEDPIPIDPNIEFKPDFDFKFPNHE